MTMVSEIVSQNRIDNIVGNTPLVRLTKLSPSHCEILAKLEYFNPGGSVKDRAAWKIIADARASGQLNHGKRLIDATSGNTGISYAWLGAALGFGVTLCVPANASAERFAMMRSFGAEIIETNPLEGTDGAQQVAREIFHREPDRWFYPDQYGNNSNWIAHFERTGPEVWTQSDGNLTHFVAAVGTSGTFIGTGRYLRSQNPEVRLIEVQPASPLHGLEGVKHMPTCNKPEIYDESVRDELLEIGTEEAQETARLLARKEGLLVGPSGAANVAAAIILAEREERAVIVTIIPDSGTRYLSEPFWRETLLADETR